VCHRDGGRAFERHGDEVLPEDHPHEDVADGQGAPRAGAVGDFKRDFKRGEVSGKR